MPFINVWGNDPRPSHKCTDCGEVVYGLEGMQDHVCPTPKDRSDDMWCGLTPKQEPNNE